MGLFDWFKKEEVEEEEYQYYETAEEAEAEEADAEEAETETEEAEAESLPEAVVALREATRNNKAFAAAKLRQLHQQFEENKLAAILAKEESLLLREEMKQISTAQVDYEAAKAAIIVSNKKAKTMVAKAVAAREAAEQEATRLREIRKKATKAVSQQIADTAWLDEL
jgi:hypothetical protein